MNLCGLSPEIAQRFAGSLLHFIWQGALIAFLAAIGLKLLSKRSAEMRYMVSSAFMTLMLAAPVLTFVFYGQTGAIALRLLQMTRTTWAVFSVPLSSSSETTAAWSHWILLAWCAGVFVFLARLIVGWYLSNRMVRTSEDAVPACIRRLPLRRDKQISSFSLYPGRSGRIAGRFHLHKLQAPDQRQLRRHFLAESEVVLPKLANDVSMCA